jgi:hypothetical protein
MRDADWIESINREQLATATDRLLLRGRVARQRLARGSQVQIAVAAPSAAPPRHPAPRAEGSQPGIGIATPPLGSLHRPRAEGSQTRNDVSPSHAAGSLPWIEIQSPRRSSGHPRIVVAPSLSHPRPPRWPLLPLQLFSRR